MSGKRVQHIRHVTGTADLFQGLEGEITCDVTQKALRYHDGVTPGGIPHARADLINAIAATVLNDGKMTAAQVQSLAAAIADIAALEAYREAITAIGAALREASSAQDARSTLGLSNASAALNVASIAIGGVAIPAANAALAAAGTYAFLLWDPGTVDPMPPIAAGTITTITSPSRLFYSDSAGNMGAAVDVGTQWMSLGRTTWKTATLYRRVA